MSKIKVGGIIRNTHLAQVSVLGAPDRPGIAAAILGKLGSAEINAQFVVQCIDLRQRDHVVFCVNQDDLHATLPLMEEVKAQIGAESVTSLPDVVIVSIFGPDFRERPGIAGRMFEALAARDVNILAISTSISTVSCVIDARHLAEAAAALSQTFDLP